MLVCDPAGMLCCSHRREADKVEEEPDEIVQEGLEPADTESMLQSKSNAVVSINAFGSIEMANKPAYQLFGCDAAGVGGGGSREIHIQYHCMLL